jgi:hypothetical protein
MQEVCIEVDSIMADCVTENGILTRGLKFYLNDISEIPYTK